MKFRNAHFEILYFEASPQGCLIFYNLPFKNYILFDINISSGGKDMYIGTKIQQIKFIYLVIDGDLYWFIYYTLLLYC